MLVPGPWRDARELVQGLKKAGFVARAESARIAAGEVGVQIVQDDKLGAGFGYGRNGALPADLVARVSACSRAAVIEYGERLDANIARVAALGRALRSLGGVAVRMEASGAASGWDEWLEHLDAGLPRGAYAASVVMVEDEPGVVFTCGMHQFDLPDAKIKMPTTQAAIDWLDAFCCYQLEEAPGLVSGHTFRPDERAARRSFERWPDDCHDPSDGRYNPFGLWRFRMPAEAGLEPSSPVSVFILPLVQLLNVSETSKGRALTRDEVDDIVASGTVMAMDPREALGMERIRGYADIEPELAWEQWQIVRRHFSRA